MKIEKGRWKDRLTSEKGCTDENDEIENGKVFD